jgi:hypothetical protein
LRGCDKPVKRFGPSVMKISLDTNVWIFGILGIDPYCERILLNLGRFEVIVPDQVRAELERNFSDFDMKQFYQFVLRFGIVIDFAAVPADYIADFEVRGLKKATPRSARFANGAS